MISTINKTDDSNQAKVLLPQNFAWYKALSGVCLFITLVIVCTVFLYFNPSLWNTGINFYSALFIFFFLGLIYIFVMLCLLHALDKYSLNFGKPNFSPRKFIFIVFLMTVILYMCETRGIIRLDGHLYYALMILMYVLFVSGFFIKGRNLYKLKDADYVGGCRAVGISLMLASVLPPLWLIVPVFTYRLFSKAERYSS